MATSSRERYDKLISENNHSSVSSRERYNALQTIQKADSILQSTANYLNRDTTINPDANEDGIVDIRDLVRAKKNIGRTSSEAQDVIAQLEEIIKAYDVIDKFSANSNGQSIYRENISYLKQLKDIVNTEDATVRNQKVESMRKTLISPQYNYYRGTSGVIKDIQEGKWVDGVKIDSAIELAKAAQNDAALSDEEKEIYKQTETSLVDVKKSYEERKKELKKQIDFYRELYNNAQEGENFVQTAINKVTGYGADARKNAKEKYEKAVSEYYAITLGDAETRQKKISELKKEANILKHELIKYDISWDDTSKEKKEAIQKELNSLNQEIEDIRASLYGKSSAAEYVGKNVYAGMNTFATDICKTFDFILGRPMKFLGWENNPFSSVSDIMKSDNERVMGDALNASLAIGDDFNVGGTIIQGVIATLPDTAIAIMSGGTSKAIQLGAKSYSWGTMLNNGLGGLAKNPMYWTSFLRTVGSDYENAMEYGATQSEATLYALLTSFVNAAVEIGGETGMGGIQNLPQALKNAGKSPYIAWQWFKSALEEGGEEVIQGLISDLSAIAIFDPDREIDLKQIAIEGGYGTAIGAILGGGQISISAIINAKTETEYRGIGAQALTDKELDFQEIIDYAKKSVDADIRALAMKSTPENINDLNAGCLYSYVCRDINTAITSPLDIKSVNKVYSEIMQDNPTVAIRSIASSQYVCRMSRFLQSGVAENTELQSTANGGIINNNQNNKNGVQKYAENNAQEWGQGGNSEGGIRTLQENLGGHNDQGGTERLEQKRSANVRNSQNRRILTEKQKESLKSTAIKNSDGSPKLVYHFTDNMDFEEFAKGDIGFHFGSKSQANSRGNILNKTGRIIEVYLDVKNPLKISTDIMSWRPKNLAIKLFADGVLSFEEYNNILKMDIGNTDYNSPAATELRRILAEKGYDGIVYQNMFEDEGESYIAFYPEQVIIVDDGLNKNNQATSDEGASFLPENAEESGSAFEEPSAAVPEYDLVKDTGAQLAGVKRYSDGQRQIMEIGRKLGYRVVFDPNLTNASGVFANGKIDRKNKVIYINPKSKRVKQWILKHELVHFGKRSDAYNRYAEIAKKSDLFYDWLKSRGANGDNAIIMLADLKQKKMDAYAEAGQPIGPAKAEEEILGDFSGDVVFSNDERGMQRFLESLDIRERNAVVQFILDFVSYLKEKFSGNKQMTVELARLERRYSKMIHEAKETTAENGDGVSYSLQYANAETNNDIKRMINKIHSGEFKANEKIYFNNVSEKTARQIQKLTGINVFGFKTAIEARQLEHILKDHGENGKSDRSLADIENIAKMEYVLKTPDEIRLSGKTQAYSYMKDGKNRTADTVLYEKIIGENSYYVVQAIADTKAKTLYVVTAFIGKSGYKKEASQLIDAKSPNVTSKDGSANASNNSISDNLHTVNTNSTQGNEDYSLAVEKDVKYSISPDTQKKRKKEPYQPVANYEPQTRDADGHKLSQGILDYFKYSMVRDSKGRLIPVYHGSKNAGFTRFAKSDDIGYFFARTLKTAQTYSGTKKIYAPDKNSAEFLGAANYKTFLNLKNPYIIDGNGLYWNNLESYGYDPVTVEIKSSYWNEDGTGKATLILEYKGKTYKQTAHNSTEFENFLAEHLNREIAVAFAHAVDAKFDENGKGHFATQIPWDFSSSKQGKSKNTRDIVRRSKGWNYDGVIFRNVIDSGDGSKIGADDLYVAFYPNQIKSVNNTEPTSDPDIRYSLDTNDETVDYTERMNVLDDDFKSGTITREEYFEKINALYKEAGEKNGTVKQGESVSGKENFDNPLPKSVKDKTKVRTHVRTIIEGGELTEEMIGDIKHRVLKGEFSYVPTSNEKNKESAQKYIESGAGKALWDNIINGKEKSSAVGIAVGEALLKGAIENGEAADVVKYTAELAELGTRLGQSVQALSLLKRMDGIGQLYYVQKTVNTLNKDLSKRFGADAPLVTLNETLARQLAQSKTQEDFETSYGAMMDHIASQVPSTFLDKWNAWRYMAMLANPTTHIRNVFGNAVFVPAIKIKDTIAVGMEQFLPQDERTKSVVVKKEYKEFAEKDFGNVADVISGGGKLNPSRGIADNRAIFDNKVLESARKFNFDMLEKEDLIFLKMHYQRALGGYLQAQGVDLKNVSNKVLQKAREYAILEAQKATYRDASALATALSDLSQKNAVANVLVEGILPFKKTPINIVKRGIEYSPVGLIKTLTQGTYQLKRGEITASQYIDGLAAGLTGTGLVALGMGLASLGFVRGGFDDDDEDQFNKLMGMQEYSVEIGGFSYTIDWMAPSSIPFFIGVTVMENMMAEDNSTTFSMISNSLLSGMEPIINLSMLSGIEDTIASARYADANEIVSSIAGKIIGSYFSQALPTIGARLANMVDPVRRTNYIDKTSHVPKFVQSAINTIEGKVPFASKLKAKYINAWGEKEYKGGVVERFFQNFLSPGYFSDVETDNVSEEIMRLAKSLGDKSVYPDTAPKKVQFKNMTKYLDREEYEKYAIEKGQMSADYVKEAVESKAYSKLEDYQKAWLINKLYEFADAKAKTNISYSYDELNAMFDGAMTKEQYERFNAKARKTLAEDYFLNKKGYKTAFKKERNGASVVDYYIKQAAKVEE